MLALKQSSQSSGKKRPPSLRGKVTLQSELAAGWLLPESSEHHGELLRFLSEEFSVKNKSKINLLIRCVV